jgi:O-antigen/teichoic acid export membrane protein
MSRAAKIPLVRSGLSGGFSRSVNRSGELFDREFDPRTPLEVSDRVGYGEEPFMMRAEADARYRNRLARLSGAASVLALAVASVLAFVTVRWTLPYLGKERFGMWMTLASFAGLLSIADLGVGNALVSRVAESRTHGRARCCRTITGGIALLAMLACGFAAAFSLAAFLIPWSLVFPRVTQAASLQEFRDGAILFGPVFGLFLLSGGIRKVYEGLQQGYVAHIVSAVASVMAIVALRVASGRQLGIPWLFLCTFGISNATLLLLLAPLMWKQLVSPCQAWSAVQAEHAGLMRVGAAYLLLQFGSLVMVGSESLLISVFQGPAAVASFAVVQRLFQYAATPARIMNAPLWGAYADARARGDFRYIRATLRRHLIGTAAITVVLVTAATLASSWLIFAWTKGAEQADQWLVVVFAIWTIVECAFLPLVVYMNGIGLVRPQAACTLFSLFTYYPVKVAAVAFLGVTEMMWVSVAFYLVSAVLFYGLLYGRELQRGWRGTA